MGWFRSMRLKLGRAIGGRKAWSEPNFWDLDRFRVGLGSSSTPNKERIENDFDGYAEGAYKSNGIVFAVATARQAIFSEARFQWRRFADGQPGALFGTPELSLLEQPWPGGTTGELLARMDIDVTIAGNFFATTADDAGRLGKRATGTGRRIAVLRPDWVTIVIHSASEDPYAADARVIAYLYEPPLSPQSHVLLMPDEVCHYSPMPDPAARFRGMSWLTPVLREISADKAATKHKQKFFENGATLTAVATLPKEIASTQFREFVEEFKAAHEGVDNAYKTLFLGGGADLTLVGADMKQIDFKVTQGAGETRIAAAGGIHPVIVGLSEGLAGSSLNAGNFSAARRLTADKTFRPLWRVAAASLQRLLTPPPGNVALWYDDREIAFVREDIKDLAEVQWRQASVLRELIDAGWEPDAAVEFLRTGDMSKLTGKHTGLFSVQLQRPGGALPPPPPPPPPSTPPALNGASNGHQAALTS